MGFTFQRSTGGIHWTRVGFRESKAQSRNSAVRIDYHFTDAIPADGHNYYRLVEISENGAEAFWDVIDLFDDGSNAVQLCPNPASDYINIRSVASGGAQIYTTNGQLVKSVAVQAGITPVGRSGLANGISIVKADGKPIKEIKQ